MDLNILGEIMRGGSEKVQEAGGIRRSGFCRGDGSGRFFHVHIEQVCGRLSCRINADSLPVFQEALVYADEFLLTAAAQKNRNHTERFVSFEGVSFAMEEVLFDPQTSGGLPAAVSREDVEDILREMHEAGLPAAAVGEVLEKGGTEILVN